MASESVITTIEVTGEDAQGNETTRTTTHSGVHLLVSRTSTFQPQGLSDSDQAIDLIDPDGWGVTWSLKAGDRVSTVADGEMTVTAVTPTRSLRSGILRHIEVVSG